MRASRVLDLLTNALVCLALTDTIQALRVPHKRNDKTITPVSQSGFDVPISNGSASLPSPPSNECLRAIGLALGTQEYSCANTNSSHAPTFSKASATLYDVAQLLELLPSEDYLHELTSYFLKYNYGSIANSSLSMLGCLSHVHGMPTFDLGASGLFQLETDYTINAPQEPLLNVDWAYGQSLDRTWTVYRVETAGGGGPTTCEGQNASLSVSYSAEYWFYKSE